MSAQAALITFSTLHDGRSTSMDPEIVVTWFRIENLATPYQPRATRYEQVFGMWGKPAWLQFSQGCLFSPAQPPSFRPIMQALVIVGGVRMLVELKQIPQLGH
jgi:hypothetical protein